MLPIEAKSLKRKSKKQLIGMAEAMIGDSIADRVADKGGYENVTKAELVEWILAAKTEQKKEPLVIHPAPVQETVVKAKASKRQAKKPIKSEKIDVKAKPKKKVPSKNALKAKMIRMAMEQLISDATRDIDGIEQSDDGVITVTGQLLVDRYSLVKTYARDRNAWKGNGRRDKEPGKWDGHRHPAPRILLELGYESLLERVEGGWKRRVIPVDSYYELFQAS